MEHRYSRRLSVFLCGSTTQAKLPSQIMLQLILKYQTLENARGWPSLSTTKQVGMAAIPVQHAWRGHRTGPQWFKQDQQLHAVWAEKTYTCSLLQYSLALQLFGFTNAQALEL